MEKKEKLNSPYNPNQTEERIYEKWISSGFFNPDNLKNTNGKTFTILMPPTNANGNLHAGHGLVMTIEDIMIRYKRMSGFKTLWLPGNDHAGFETQVVYEKQLEKEGRSRFDLPKEDLYKEIFNFTQNNRKNINSQIKKMGASCDWSREKFTLDDSVIETVYKTFKKLSDDNLIYRGNKIINWCPKHQTSFSDLEIIDEERTEKFYYLKYGPFTIGTSRPETKFGDKYVVVHPNDKRYENFKDGEQMELEWINGKITATLIKDEAIDMEFGTGAMTITPWHDQTDFEIAERHNLEKEQIIDEKGRLLPISGEFAGMKILEAREKIIEKLQSKGLVVKIDDNYKHNVKLCYKCNSLIEPQIKSQWFIKMKPLAQEIIKSIDKKEIVFIPDHYEKIIKHWLSNIIDWNISRQIVWGIKIPAKICDACGNGFVDLENKIEKCSKCNSVLREDTDTFDTWFSSGQWPFASLGFPNGDDFKNFYPTQVMETAGEIIFFWVSRMLMLGKYITGKLPFDTVYLHGLVLDEKGRKMSKSKGNVINPLEITEKYGTDAFRMAIVVGNTPGTSLSLSENKIKAYKHFANKIWNISRFIDQNTENNLNSYKENVLDEDKKIISEFESMIKEITKEMDEFKFYIVAEKIYSYIWHNLADIIIEDSKKILQDKETKEFKSRSFTLNFILKNCLILLHPFMPFLTEELWDIKDYGDNLIMIEKWPDIK